jgi:tetratricopeptide (TPR) repeat protein
MTYNRKFLFGLLALGLLLSCTQQMSKEVKEKIKTATVHVRVKVNGGGASGFFVAPDKIVTNIHVIAGKQDISVISTKTTYEIKEVIGFDPEHDLVVLQVKPKGTDLPPEGTPLHLGRGKIGDQIFAAGYPGQKYNLTEGTIYDIWNKGKQLRLVSKGALSNSKDSVPPRLSPLISGNSGGAVVNSKGEVVGVAVTGEKIGSNTPAFGGATSAIVLEELLYKSESSEPLSLLDWQKEPCVLAYASHKHGEDKIEAKNYDEAIKYFDDASKSCPNYAAAHLGLGKANLNLGKFNAAIASCTEVIKLIPDYAEAHFYIGTARAQLGKKTNGEDAKEHYKAAIRAFDEAIKRCEDADYYRNRGAAKFLLGELDQENAITLYNDAINDFTEAIKLDPADAAYYGNLGVAKILLGELDQENAITLYNDAINDFTEAIKLDPADAAYYGNLGIAKFRLGKLKANQENAIILYNDAINDFTEAIKLDPENATTYGNRAAAKFHLGELETNQGRAKIAQSMYDEVIKDWTEAIKRAPNNANNIKLGLKPADGYYMRGILNLLLGQSKANQRNVEEARQYYNAAISDFNEAAKLNPDGADVYYDKAINMLNPDDAITYLMRGAMKSRRGKSKANQGDVAEAQLHYQGAIKDYQEAIEQYEEAIKQNSVYTASAAYSNLGYTKYLLGKSFESETGQENMEYARNLYEEAIADSTQAIKLNRNKASAYSSRGVAKAGIKDYDGAIADLNKSIDLKSDFAESYYELSLVKRKIGRKKEADAALKKAKELDPDVGK